MQTTIETPRISEYFAAMRHLHETNDLGFNDARYPGYEAMVHDLGRPFERKPLPSDFEPGEMGNCYQNAYDLVNNDLYAIGESRYEYVEGYAAGLLPLPHAWVLDTDDDKIIDSTWPDDDEHTEYYGIVFPFEFVQDVLQETGCYGLLGNDYLLHGRMIRRGPELWTP